MAIGAVRGEDGEAAQDAPAAAKAKASEKEDEDENEEANEEDREGKLRFAGAAAPGILAGVGFSDGWFSVQGLGFRVWHSFEGSGILR